MELQDWFIFRRLATENKCIQSQVLKEGDKVKVKIIKIENNKISLSIREAAELTSREVEEEGPAEYEDNGAAATGLGALLKGFKLN